MDIHKVSANVWILPKFPNLEVTVQCSNCLNKLFPFIGGATPKIVGVQILWPTVYVLQTIYDLYATTLG